jgi:DNA-binding NarL/FixJ family response regulator
VDILVVCDPEPIAMEGLRSLMESIDGPRVAAVETEIEVAAAAVRELRPGLLLVNKSFGASAIADWVRLLREAGNPAGVIVWASSLSESESLRLLQAGVSGVIRKTASLDQLAACVRTVLTGGNWMERELPAGPPHHRSGRSALTAREVQVMDLVERGFKNKEIGDNLGIRTGTVKIHLKHIFEKTGIHGRYGLALSGLKHKGLLALAN